MMFSMLSHHESSPPPPLTARIKSQDGSVVLAHIADVKLRFKTAFGYTQIPLSRIRRMCNVANLHTLKKVKKLNRFQIDCFDGNEIFGFPASPDRLQVAVLGVARAWTSVRIVEIDSLEILPKKPENKFSG